MRTNTAMKSAPWHANESEHHSINTAVTTVQGNADTGQRTDEQLQRMTNEVVVTARRLLNDHLGVCGARKPSSQQQRSR